MKTWENVKKQDLRRIADEIKEIVETPSLILLSGPVGAGKTTFAKDFMPEEAISSPTYSIVNEIDNCVHADLYRLNDPSELIHLELPLYLEDKDYFLVEWGAEYLPHLKRLIEDDYSYYELTIEVVDETTRRFTLNSRGK